MSLNRLSPNSDLSTDGGRGQLNETLELMAAEIRRLKDKEARWDAWGQMMAQAQGWVGAQSIAEDPSGAVAAASAGGAIEAFTPTGSWTTNTTYYGFKIRNGNLLYCVYYAEFSGVPDVGSFQFHFPPGETPNMNHARQSNTPGGAGYLHDASTGQGRGVLWGFYNHSTATINVLYNSATNTFAGMTRTGPLTIASGDWLMMFFCFPVVGDTTGSSNTSGPQGVVLPPPPPAPPTNPWRHGIPRYSTGPL